jgi:diaminopimelate epimerase
MMSLTFSKYQGTGNDFILIDNRVSSFSLNREQIAGLCHRRFGVGADGLILLNAHPDYDFQMINYNSDGGECSMCGNGGRSLVQFAFDLGIKKEHYRFLAVDGEHQANLKEGRVELKMQNVTQIKKTELGIALNTGSPHLVIFKTDVENLDVRKEGEILRHADLFKPDGINVNFIEVRENSVLLRTFERGVEDETLSCGTGAIASAIVSKLSDTKNGQSHELITESPGGRLTIRFKRVAENQFDDIWLIGEAKKVFTGLVENHL